MTMKIDTLPTIPTAIASFLLGAASGSAVTIGITGERDIAEQVAEPSSSALPTGSPDPCEATSGSETGETECVPLYCEAFPERCSECLRPPCGTPSVYVCCDGSGACVGVHTFGECGDGGDIYWCEWGAQHVDPVTGKPWVECFD